MKKKLEVGNITNELAGASLFFTKPVTPPTAPVSEQPTIKKKVNSLVDSLFFDKPITPLPQAQKEDNRDQKRTNVLSDVRTYERTNVRTKVKPKRQKIRHAFDIYQDQLISLQMRQLEAVQRGKRKPKLGKMVQDAIDLYLRQSEKK